MTSVGADGNGPRGSWQIGAARIFATAVGAGSAVLIARAVGPAGRGVTAAVQAAALILPIVLAVGMPMTVRRQAAAGSGERTLRTARIVALASALAAMPLAWWMASQLVGGMGGPTFTSAVVCFSSAPVTVLWMCEQSYLIGTGRYSVVAVLQIAPALILFVGAAAFAALGLMSVEAVIWLTFGGSLVNAAVSFVANITTLAGEHAPLGEVLSESVTYAGAAVAEASNSRLDQVLALPILGAHEAGLYSVAATFGAIPWAAAYALGANQFNSVARSSGTSANARAAQGIKVGLVVGLVVAALLVILIPIGVPIVFGRDYFEATIPSLILAALGAGLIPSYLANITLGARNLGARMTAVQFVGLGAAAALLLVLGGGLGAVGASMAAGLSYWLILVLSAHAHGISLSATMPSRRFVRALVRSLRKNRADPR